ncbi:MAG TPA: insulinase family protein [Anaerolineales bacterium]|nr:insulinase family protein [Anaerolineales bacterium]
MHGFTLLQETEVPELNTLVRYYRHDKSGARLLSLVNDDENKSFGIAFRTIPEDSTGIAHILEHGVLNGSRKYPVKEPFIELLKGSLNTFLNAFTFPDKTVYPVASTNGKDFYNLVDVYLDAVFHPLIQPHILDQEGWHFELESPQADLAFKGVVFNEMKGAYSSPENRLGENINQSLFPDTIYAHDSGGDPKAIPELTYEAFKAFHKKYYHPSNALIFFYGDDDPAARLQLMDDYLRDYDAIAIDALPALQPPFDEERRLTHPYPAGEDGEVEKKSMVSVNWMLPEPDDMETAFAGDILSHILLGTQAAPLRKALIDSGLGENLVGGGLSEYTRQPTFSVGMRGIESGDAVAVENVILETLARLADEGIDKDTIEASLNTIEFNLRENNTGSFPRGLMLFMVALNFWSYGRDPIEPLFFEAPMKALRARFETGERIFESLIRAWLLENRHRTTILLEPDPDLRNREEAEERDRLAEIRAELTGEQIEAMVAHTHELRRIQEAPNSPEALATLPFLKLEDLDREFKLIPKTVREWGGMPVLHHDLFTNGIVYLDLSFDLHTLPQDLLPYVPSFTRCILGMGTETEDFVKLTQRIGRKIGGLTAGPFVSPALESDDAVARVFLRGKCTLAQTDDLLEILRDVLLTLRLDDRERFRQMVLETKASKEASLVPSGHSYVNTRLRSQFGEAYWVNEQFGGLSSLFFVRDLAKELEDDWPGLLEKLERIRGYLFSRTGAVANVTLDEENWTAFSPALEAFLAGLPANGAAVRAWARETAAVDEGFTLPAQVNYVAKGANLFDHGYAADGSALVVNKYLLTTYLWDKIRVQGGAYGGMAAWDRMTGVYSFLSYRDPNLLGTLANYDGAPGFLRDLDIDKDELTKTIIGTIGDVDGYQLPDAKGYSSLIRYLTGVTDENRQVLREQVLDTRPGDFKQFGEALEAVRDHGKVVVLGSADAIREANEQHGGDWLEIRKAL